jgi:hypothetical protein
MENWIVEKVSCVSLFHTILLSDSGKISQAREILCLDQLLDRLPPVIPSIRLVPVPILAAP